MATTANPNRMRAVRAVGWAVLAAVLALAAALLLPLQPSYPSLSLDDSFAATLHYAAAHPAAAPGLISPFGPLGFAFFDLYLPETYGWLLAVQAAFAAVILSVLAWWGWTAWRSPWGAALAIGAAAPLLMVPDVRFWCLAMLAVLIELRGDRSPPTLLRMVLGAAIGVAALIKVTFLMTAAIAVGTSLAAALRDRRVPYLGLAALTAVLAASATLRMSGTDWLAYLDWSGREMVPGYAAAMQLPSPPGLIAHAVAVLVAVGVAATAAVRPRGAAHWGMAALAIAGVLFILFKAGFVRADSHVFITVLGLLAVAILLAVHWARSPASTLIAIGAVLALPGALFWHALAARGRPPSLGSPTRIVRRLRALPEIVFAEALPRTYAERMAALRDTLRRPLPAIDSCVDVYSYQQSLALAYALDLRPRPVFQSYMAYTPRLAHANADRVAGDDGLRWILFEPATIDGRFPALDDAPTLPLLLAGYRVVATLGRFAVLERRPSALPWRLVPRGRVQTTTDAPIEVPTGLVWVRIDVAESIGDRLVTALFTGPYVFLDATFRDGTSAQYRLVPAIAADGFLLSPVIATPRDLTSLIEGGAGAASAPAVARFRIRVESPFGSPMPRAVDVALFQLLVGAPAP